MAATLLLLFIFSFIELSRWLHTRMALRYASFVSARCISVHAKKLSRPQLDQLATRAVQQALTNALGDAATKKAVDIHITPADKDAKHQPLQSSESARINLNLQHRLRCMGGKQGWLLPCKQDLSQQWRSYVPLW